MLILMTILIQSNENNVIENMNNQIKINDNFNKSINTLLNAIKDDRIIVQEFIENKVNKTTIKLLIIETKLRIQELNRIINELQDDIIFSNLNIIHPSLLTHNEIKDFQIDVTKIKRLKVGFSKTNTNKLIFLIKIPNEMININKI